MEYSFVNILILLSVIIAEFIIWQYYSSKEVLPIRNNKIFFKMLKYSLMVMVINVIGVGLSMFRSPTTFNLVLHNLLIVLYFVLYEQLFLYLLEYVMLRCGIGKHFVEVKPENYFPGIVLFMMFITYIFGFEIFYLDNEGVYHDGNFNFFVRIFPLFVVIYSIIITIRSSRKKSVRMDTGVLYALIILLYGVVINIFVRSIATIEYFFVISTVVLYITTENPEFFISENMNVYNHHGFKKLVNEIIDYKEDVYIFGIGIRNFESLENRYDVFDFYGAMDSFAEFLIKLMPDDCVFYTDNGCFNIVSMSPIDIDTIENILTDRMRHPFEKNGVNVYIYPKFFSVDFASEHCIDASDIIHGERYALKKYIDRTDSVVIEDTIFKQLAYDSKVEDIIQRCIEEREIEVYIQPLYNSVSGKMEGGEVLTRIKDKELGLIMPDSFISLAEKNGKIIDLGEVIFEKTCIYMRDNDLTKAGIKFININCSPIQFQDVNLVGNLKLIADFYGIDFSLFDFEVTESAACDEDLMKLQIENFRKNNATVSLDDFGEGNSNISRLVGYDFSIAKLDKSLVWDYFNNTNSVIIDVVRMFKRENLKIVAEGVETIEMVNSLSEMGCDYLQGYYFSKPMPASAFMDYISKFNKEGRLV